MSRSLESGSTNIELELLSHLNDRSKSMKAVCIGTAELGLITSNYLL